MLQKSTTHIYTASCHDGINIRNTETQLHTASRATRAVDDSTRFFIVSVNRKADDHILRRTLAQWIHEGIDYNGTIYRFLGATESQIKAGKLTFFREGNGWTVDRLLAGFGDLPAVYLKSGYGKYAARLGLSFSSTVASLDIPPECAISIPDLTAPDGSLHSDGCGMIRDSFAAQVCVRHQLPPDTTVFQIRRGGIKGLLVRYPDTVFNRLCRERSRTRGGHYMIAYRPSMLKYMGGLTTLELNNHNLPPPAARLNIQFTALLLTLGVPFEVFTRLVQDQLDLIGSILTNREKALQYVKGELDAAAEDDFAQGLYAMLLAGQDLSEPYVRQRLQNFQKKQYESLRKKMILRIPHSAYLFGVVDEDGVLGPNEVYVNLPSRSGVLVRDVVVARNPSYHPGDFRKLHAVDHPSLRHHRNCIVFPSTAAHSVPDTIASGDLDGDLYFVCWDQSLIPPKQAGPFNRAQSATAAAQSGAAPPPTTRQLSDMPQAAVDTFMQLKFNRLLGMMSNEWMRQVELTPQLADAPYCQGLVPLIESALDLMKSGEDFAKLERQFKGLKTRHAGRNLDGFRSDIQRLRDMIPHGVSEPLTQLDTLQDQSLILREEDPPRWNHHVSEAAQVLSKFNRELSDAIRFEEDYSESYGSISQHGQDRDKPRRADRVKQLYQSQYFGGGNRQQQGEQRMRASAWYYYGYTKGKTAFSWLGERYLNEIKAWWSNGNRAPLFVGAAIPRPAIVSSSPLSRLDSQATLVDQDSQVTPIDQPSASRETQTEVPMDIDGETIPDEDHPTLKKNRTSTDCRCRRHNTHDEDIESRRTSSRTHCAQPVEPVRVPVASNPKPRAPVATRVAVAPTVCAGTTHQWRITSANATARRYLCLCGIEVREKKKNGFWVNDQYNIAEPREANHTSPQPRQRKPEPEEEDPPPPKRRALHLSPVQEESVPADHSSDADSDSESMYVSADERTPEMSMVEIPSLPRRSSTDRTSGGTTCSDAPSSLCGLPLRRLPARPGSDISSPAGRSRQVSSSTRRTSGSTAGLRTPACPARSDLYSPPAPSPTVVSPDWPLVSDIPKPAAPVTTFHTLPCRSGAAHRWHCDWGSGTHRRYKCLDCTHKVVERKQGQPQVWVPA